MTSEDKQDDEALHSNEDGELSSQVLSDIESLPDPFEDMEHERDQYRAMAQRARADLVNYRRRVDEERQELRRNANADLIVKFLGFVDDFERAIGMLPEDVAEAGWQEGLMLVKRKLDSILESEGVSRIEARGQPFDPWEHEAVHFLETPDVEDGVIAEVFRDGYRLHNKVLRASQVIVAKSPAVDKPASDSLASP